MTYEEVQKLVEETAPVSYVYETDDPIRVRRGKGRVEMPIEGDAWDEIRAALPFYEGNEYEVEGDTIAFRDGRASVKITLAN